MPSTATERHASGAVPARYRDRTLDDYRPGTATQSEALNAARLMVVTLTGQPTDRDPVRSLVLLGPPGVGKSHLAAAVCHEVHDRLFRPWAEASVAASEAYVEARRRWDATDPLARSWSDRPEALHPSPPYPRDLPLWANLPSLLTDLKAEMSAPRDEQGRTDWARSLRTARGLLVLDDLGRERISEWTGELVYAIVNDRYEAGLPTIATSNLAPEELVAAGYWPAISRLAEDGRLVSIAAPDQRLRRP